MQMQHVVHIFAVCAVCAVCGQFLHETCKFQWSALQQCSTSLQWQAGHGYLRMPTSYLCVNLSGCTSSLLDSHAKGLLVLLHNISTSLQVSPASLLVGRRHARYLLLCTFPGGYLILPSDFLWLGKVQT